MEAIEVRRDHIKTAGSLISGARSLHTPLHTLVVGLRWDPSTPGLKKQLVDLDLCCVLLGRHRDVVDIVHPRHPRNANDSVVHTGNSVTGAGAWDDEKLFMFLDVLPADVSAVMLVVASATGQPLAAAPNATCDINDHETEEALLRVGLSEHGEQQARCVCAFERTAAGWSLSVGAATEMYLRAMVEILALTACSKA